MNTKYCLPTCLKGVIVPHHVRYDIVRVRFTRCLMDSGSTSLEYCLPKWASISRQKMWNPWAFLGYLWAKARARSSLFSIVRLCSLLKREIRLWNGLPTTWTALSTKLVSYVPFWESVVLGRVVAQPRINSWRSRFKASTPSFVAYPVQCVLTRTYSFGSGRGQCLSDKPRHLGPCGWSAFLLRATIVGCHGKVGKFFHLSQGIGSTWVGERHEPYKLWVTRLFGYHGHWSIMSFREILSMRRFEKQVCCQRAKLQSQEWLWLMLFDHLLVDLVSTSYTLSEFLSTAGQTKNLWV